MAELLNPFPTFLIALSRFCLSVFIQFGQGVTIQVYNTHIVICFENENTQIDQRRNKKVEFRTERNSNGSLLDNSMKWKSFFNSTMSLS